METLNRLRMNSLVEMAVEEGLLPTEQQYIVQSEHNHFAPAAFAEVMGYWRWVRSQLDAAFLSKTIDFETYQKLKSPETRYSTILTELHIPLLLQKRSLLPPSTTGEIDFSL